MRSDVQPFFFPTTVIFVDDSNDFLLNLSLQLNPLVAFRLFQSPTDALIALDKIEVESSLSAKNIFSLYQDRDETGYGRQVIDVSLNMIHREVHDETRFDQISVVVVDYDMPQMNGVEFCRRIKNPLVKKILLTGKADERTAVDAFNRGLIDRFIRKQEADVIETLGQAIREMQLCYFSQMEKVLSDALSIGSHRFLKDSKFAERFEELSQHLNIVEHYLSCAPSSILMRNAVGTSYLLVVQSEEQFQATYEIAFDQQASEELLRVLRSGDVVPYFWKTQGNYSPVYEDWHRFLHPATKIQGDEWYAYALVKNPEGFNFKYALCYADYLARLDEQECGRLSLDRA